MIAEGWKSGNFMRAPKVSVLVTQLRGNQAAVLWQVNRPGHLPIQAPALSLPALLAIACHCGEVRHLRPMRLERGLNAMQAFATGDGADARGTEKGPRVHRKGQDGKLQVLRLAMDDVLGNADVVCVLEGLF